MDGEEVVSTELPDEASFNAAANAMNEIVRAAWSANMPQLLHYYASENDAGPVIVAGLAGIVTALGFIVAGFEPGMNAEVLARMLVDQFNEGRKAYFQMQSEGVVQ
jgi:hypothetical protein